MEKTVRMINERNAFRKLKKISGIVFISEILMKIMKQNF